MRLSVLVSQKGFGEGILTFNLSRNFFLTVSFFGVVYFSFFFFWKPKMSLSVLVSQKGFRVCLRTITNHSRNFFLTVSFLGFCVFSVFFFFFFF